MSLFSKLYDECIKLSSHRYARFFLVLNSFIESIFWPIPVDVMLAPMALAKRDRAYYYALEATIASVLGAVIGYYIGYFLYDPYVAQAIDYFNYKETFEKACTYMKEWGIIFVLIGSFTPLPYKIVAIACGMIASSQVAQGLDVGQYGIITFMLVSFLGRGLRFLLISFLIRLGGEKLEQKIRKYINVIGWIVLGLIAVVIAYYCYKKTIGM